MFRIFRVRGNSMQPTLNEGDYVVALSRFCLRWFRPKVGKIVVVNHPMEGVMIKRVVSESECSVRLCGDNVAESISTEKMGDLDKTNILGRALFVVTQKSLFSKFFRT